MTDRTDPGPSAAIATCFRNAGLTAILSLLAVICTGCSGTFEGKVAHQSQVCMVRVFQMLYRGRWGTKLTRGE